MFTIDFIIMAGFQICFVGRLQRGLIPSSNKVHADDCRCRLSLYY